MKNRYFNFLVIYIFFYLILILSLTTCFNFQINSDYKNYTTGIWLTTGDESNKLSLQEYDTFISGGGINSIKIEINENITYHR